MNTVLTPSHLCALAQELAEVATYYQAKNQQKQKLTMNNSQTNDQDEIYVISEDLETRKKWPIVRVALTKLSEEERAQLNLQIAIHNKTITETITA